MAYKPVIGGYRHRALVGRARGKNRKLRGIFETIVETGPDRAALYQLLTAAVLLSAQIDEVLADLDEFEEPAKPAEEG
jgi:hypothetical protein